MPAQLILPSLNETFSQIPNFNPDYIRSHKIKSIVFDILDKKDLQIAVDKGLIHNYEFNEQGYLTRFYYTSISKTIVKEIHTAPVYRKRRKISNGSVTYRNEYLYDTVSTNFFYNDKNKLILKRYRDGNYYEATYYTYDSTGNTLREYKCKETNVSLDKNVFQIGVQNVLSDENFTYEFTGPRQIKKKSLNDEKRAFKETILNFNDDLQRISEYENFIATFITQSCKYMYNAKGQMTEKVFESNSNGKIKVVETFDYDKHGNILTQKQFKNDVLLNELSYIIDENTNLVNSFLNRDHINKSIRITKLYFAFY